MLVEWRFKKPHCHKKEPSSYQLGCFSSIYSLGRCASHSIPFKVKYTFLIPCLLECPSLHLHISPMSFHPSWPTFRPRVRSKYLHRLSDTTLLHTCIQLPGGLKHSIEFLQHWKGVCATVFQNTIALKKANVLTKCHLRWTRSYWIIESSSMLREIINQLVIRISPCS